MLYFSTISVHCEPKGWGSRFPHLMKVLYQGRLPAQNVPAALVELRDAKESLSKLPPSAVVWDIENRASKPPWGDKIAPDITDLGNYFVSSTGRDLFALLEEALTAAGEESNENVFVEVVAPQRVVVEHLSESHHFFLTIAFDSVENKTSVGWRQVFDNVDHKERVAHIVEEANEQNLDRLEAEVRNVL